VHKLFFNPNDPDHLSLLEISEVSLLSNVPLKVGKNIHFKVKCIKCGKEYTKPSCTFGRTKCQCRKTINGAFNYKGTGNICSIYFNRVRERAGVRGIEFNITAEDMLEKYNQQNGKCALSGIDITLQRNYKKYKKMTASLDRIDSSKSYTIDNIQWVHRDINIMKNHYNEEYFIEMCKLIAKNKSNNE